LLNFRDLIANPSIGQLSDLIETQTKSTGEIIELVHLTSGHHLPLTKNQKRLWLISKLQPDNPSYIIPLTYKLKGSLDRARIEESLKLLFQRHYLVFSVIKEKDDNPYCDIVPTEVKVSFQDYTELSEIEKEKRLNDFLISEKRKAFCLEEGPLFRLNLIKTHDDEHYFSMSIHHIIFDGWSQGVLINDLNTIYNCLSSGIKINLEELEFQQYDYANWENGQEERKESIDFWIKNLQGCSPVINFPFDYPRNENSSGKGGAESIRFPETISKLLKQIAKEEGSTLFTVMMSAFGILMHKYSGDNDLNIGLPVAYRPHTKLEKIIGMFVNTVAVRFRYDENYSFRDAIKLTGESILNAMAHQDLSFDRVVEIVNPARVTNTNPLFQVDFTWQNGLDIPLNLEGTRSERVKVKEGISIFDLSVSLCENGDFIEGEVNFNLDIIRPDTISRLIENFITLVKNLIERIDTPIHSVSMVSDETIKIINNLNETRTSYPKETIVKLFENQVVTKYEKIALTFNKQTLTYGQLNEKANQLAHTLRELGITDNDPVVIFAEKSLEMIVGILGILKAGGCYVPIDPEYPLERVTHIIRDSECRIVLTQDKICDRIPFVHEIKRLSLDSLKSYHSEKSNPAGINVPSDLAYIIYTSGTTGMPKGTLLTHQSVVRLVVNTNYIDIRPEDRVLQCNSIVFDASVEEIFGALLNGATLY